MATMVDSANSTVTPQPSAHLSPLCGGNGRLDCLFTTELGEFRAWHLLLIIAFVVVAALAVICKVIRCRRWPVAKKRETPASDDIRLEEIESCDHRQQQTLLVDSTPLELLPPTSATEQREPSPRGSPYPLPQEGGVVAIEGVHDQLGAAVGYTPRPLEVQVEMTEVPQQKPVQHYQLSQPLYESTMEGPMSFGGVEDDRNILSLPTMAMYHSTLPGDGEGGNEVNYPRKRRFRESHVQRHSFHFETPQVSFRLDEDKLGRPQHEADDTSALPNASHPLSLQYTASLPAPVPAYQRYGSYQGSPYIGPTGGRDQGGARNGGAGELEEAAGSVFVLSAEV